MLPRVLHNCNASIISLEAPEWKNPITTLIISDEYGNTDEYTFTIEQGSNVGIFILLGVIVLMAIGGGVFVLIKKKNRI